MWLRDMQSAISIKQLTKTYRNSKKGRKTAVDSLSLDVKRGEIFGFLGPNGAGKTTTIKTLLGFMRPTSGIAEIMGISAEEYTSRECVGYLPEQPYFYKFMTPREIVSMHAALIGVGKKVRKEQVRQVLETVGLTELANQRVSKLSKGQVQRVGIAQALVGDPKILILDEPSSGLDPLGRRQIRDLLIQQKELGRTVFLSSHLLSEIEMVCDRVAVLAAGKLKAIGTPEEIKQSRSQMNVTVAKVTPELENRVSAMGEVEQLVGGNTVITVESDKVYSLIDILRDSDTPLVSVSPAKESLEEAFLRLAA